MSDVLGAGLDYVTLGDVRNALVEANDVFNRIDELSASDMGSVEAAGNMDSAPFESPISNYYMTDPISRAFLAERASAKALSRTSGSLEFPSS